MDSFLSGLGMDNQNSSSHKGETREGPSVEDWIASPFSGPEQLARVEAYKRAAVLASTAFRFAGEGEGPQGLLLPFGTWSPQEFAHRDLAGFADNHAKMRFGSQWGVEAERREGSGAVPSGAGMSDGMFRNVGCQPMTLNDGGTPERSVSGEGRSDHVDVKAVNRSHLTQKRYREKQKAKTADLVTRVEQYQTDLKALQDQKADLIGRNKMLMELLQERDQQIAELQAGRGVRNIQPLIANPGLQPEPHPPEPEGTSHSSADGLAESPSVALTLTVADKPICFTQQQMRAISPANLAKFWKEYVAKLALLLVAAENKAAPDHLLQRVKQLTEEALAIMTAFSHPNPISTKLFVSQKVEEDQGIFAREESHEAWLHTAESLKLTSAQQVEVKQLRDAYLANLDSALQRRADAVREMMETGSSRVSMRRAALHYLKTCTAQAVIQKLLEEEVLLIVAFVRKLFGEVLTPVQRARYMVQAYPWIPDHLAFATAVAAQGGDAEARQSLQMLHHDWSAAAADSSSM